MIQIVVLLNALPPCVPEQVPWYLKFLPYVPVGSVVLACFTFWLGWNQKENDRCFSFYKESVIAPSMSDLESFLDLYRERLVAEAKRPVLAETRKTSPRDLTKFLASFSEDLYQVKDSIVRRVETFDSKAAKDILAAIETFDTDITVWLCSPGQKSTDVLNECLRKTKRTMIETIYKGNFKILR